MDREERHECELEKLEGSWRTWALNQSFKKENDIKISGKRRRF